MKRGEKCYIWQLSRWPEWEYHLPSLSELLAEVSLEQGKLLGRLNDVGFVLRGQASLAALTDDVIKTSAIEGEILNVDSVRSSLSRRLGVEIGGLAPAERNVDGVVDMIIDATTHADKPLTAKRLFGWHAALFPTGHSGMTRIRVAQWRNDADGPMQVISGPVSRRVIHFEAPPAGQLPSETRLFLKWANTKGKEPMLIKAALAHLWFVTLHPFEDGNGRIARALGDLYLSRADGSPQRFYSLSAQIQRERKAYYDILEKTQKGTLDVTEWLFWFLTTLRRAIECSHEKVDSVLQKSRFWQQWTATSLNPRQVKVLNALLDGFEGKLTSKKWAALTKSSPDTALRDITELLEKGILEKTPGGGRSTAYELSPLQQHSDKTGF